MSGDVRLTGHLCLTAGAGAGKTHRLVQTYLTLLEGWEGQLRLAPGQIAAITFTEKAAAEMRARTLTGAAERARADAPPGGEHWRGLAAALEWAPITTIHGFCAQVLRDYGTALGLDPDFAILDAEAHAELLEEAAGDLARTALQSGDLELGRLLRHHDLGGPAGLQGLLPGLHQQLATLGITAGQARRNTAMAHRLYRREALSRAPVLAQAVESVLAEFAADSKMASSKAQYAQSIRDIGAAWPDLRARLLADPEDEAILEQISAFINTLRGKFPSAKAAGMESIAQLRAASATVPAAELSDAALALLEGFEQVVSQEKSRRSCLSFDDLLMFTYSLLHDFPEVLEKLRSRLPVLMVDEYQDVNPVQGRLVSLLAGLEDPGSNSMRLLAVGDRKQSIYAFRGAEVSVFSDLMARFQAGDGRLEALPCNYRSTPLLVGFFNRIFAPVFADREVDQAEPDASFVEFISEDLQEPGGTQQDSEQTAVEVLDCRGLADPRAPLAAWRVLEARALGRHLADLVREGQAAPGEIVLLFRRLTQVGIYEEGLREAGLDHYTVRGRGFFACQEISDLCQALLAVLDPDDQTALAAFLRSPLVGLSDEVLLALARGRNDGRPDLAEGFRRGEVPSWAGAAETERFETARRALDGLRPLARRLSPAELVRALVEELDLMPVFLGLNGGEQRAANLRKLLEMARTPGGLLGGDVESFARGLARLVENPPQDAQAPLMGEDASVVRLMSVHQAKGLEFPVVVLADLAGAAPAGGSLPDLGPGGELADSPWDPRRGQKLRSCLYLALRRRARQRQAAEEARLFYVAATRASRRLVFSLHGCARGQGRWSRWVAEHVMGDPAALLVDAAEMEARTDAPRPCRSVTWPDRLPPEPGPAAGEGAAVVTACLDAPPPRPTLVRESVSGLEDWLSCPRRYLFTRRLGLDSAVLSSGDGGGAGAGLGSLVHRLLERTDPAAGARGLEQAARRLGLAPGNPENDLALARAEGLWDTELAPMLAGLRPEQVFREHGFLLRLDAPPGRASLLLRGEIDLFFPGPDGRLVVADYKVTDHVDPAVYRTQLMIYGLAVRRALASLAPPPRLFLCYLTSEGGRLHKVTATDGELEALSGDLLAAAQGIAGLGALQDPAGLPVSPECRRRGCSLAALCPEDGP